MRPPMHISLQKSKSTSQVSIKASKAISEIKQLARTKELVVNLCNQTAV